MGKLLQTPVTQYSQLAAYSISLSGKTGIDGINTELYNVNIERTNREFCPKVRFGLGEYQHDKDLIENKHYAMLRELPYDLAFMFIYGVNVVRSGYFLMLKANQELDLRRYTIGNEPAWISMGMDYATEEFKLLLR